MTQKFQPPKGTRDISPEEMIKRQFVIDTVRKVFEKYGFVPLETPAFESFELLSAKGSGGEAIKDEIYYFKDKAGRGLGLRFDMTVGMARFAASNPAMPKPFRRYAIGKVWRYDNPQAFRFREFWQADIDIVGSPSVAADAECIACFSDCLKALGFENYCVRVNNRKILESYLLSKGVDKSRLAEWFRSIDKFDKIGRDRVKKELVEKGFEKKFVNDIIEYLTRQVAGKEGFESFKELDGYKEISELIKICGDYGVDNLFPDPLLVRGLEYYTGNVFELAMSSAKKAGVGDTVSFGGGGRYDNLIKLFGGPDAPAVGISFGLDRLILLMEEKNLFEKTPQTITKVFVANVDENSRKYALEVATELRKTGVPTETNLLERKLGKQLEYASATGIPFVVIVGSEEMRNMSAKLRDMKNGAETVISREKLAGKMNSILAEA